MAITPLFSQPSEKRSLIHQKALEGLSSLFPIATTKYDIHIEDVKVVPKDFSTAESKQALLEGKSLTEPVTGTVVMKDKTGKVIDRVKNYRLMSLPFFTDQHTFIVNGNSYSVGNQLRTKPGIYTRVRRNEVPEVAFNLSKGSNFKITMDPGSSVFKLEHGSSSIPLYPILKSLGVSDKDLEVHWGKEIVTKNSGLSKSTYETAISKLYEKVVPPKDRSTEHDINEKVNKLRGYFEKTVVDPETTKTTLGTAYTSVRGDTILHASGKLLKVFRDEVEHDDRDSLEFQKIHSVDDFVKERLQKGGPEVVKKIKFKADTKKDITSLRDVLPPSPFSPTIKSLITQFTLSRTPDQINPLEIMDAAMKVTRMGEGGIGSLRAVPEATRDLHVSHLGILDPVKTTDSSSIGVDLRAALATAKDDLGNIYASVRDVRTNKISHVDSKIIRQKTLAFPNQELKGQVSVVKDGKIQTVPAHQVDYQIPNAQSMLGPSTSLIPFIDNMQGNRALMGAKYITQALPLKYREEPLVQVAAPGKGDQKYKTMNAVIGTMIVKHAPTAGTITKVDPDFIHMKGSDGTVHKLSYSNNFPLNSKTYLHEDVMVKAGDHVKKDQQLTESNFTQNGNVALGRNAYVAYMPYHGENSNDAVVISEGAAQSFTSMHMYKKILELDSDIILDKKLYFTSFPNKITADQINKLDDKGVAKKGETLHYGDPVILALRKAVPNETDLMLGRLHKSLMGKYRDITMLWDHDNPGVVTDLVVTGGRIALTVKTEAPIVVGDKLSGSFGNKAVVSRIIPDHQMPHDATGKPLEILIASTGVVSRINPGQLLETALGKVAKKTGKTVLVENFSGEDKLKLTKAVLKQHGIPDKETLTDPITGRKIPGIFTGYQHIYKLFKSTDTNFGARGTGSYDINEQPTRGGSEGSKRLGGMEVNALLAHGATNLLREAMTLKSQKNVDWWNAFKTGAPLPIPKRSFAVDKLTGMLAGAGIKVEHKSGQAYLKPLTDRDIKEMSHGTITEPTVLRKKDLKPELGGLFDPLKTGGVDGEKWSDIKLSESIIKPLFMKPAASLLKMSETGLEQMFLEKGGSHILGLLKQIKVPALKKEAQDEIKNSSGQKLDVAVKRLKFISGLEKADLHPSEAYMGHHLAVLPPKMRPIVPGPNNQLLVADSNHLYREVLLADQKLQEMKKDGITDPADLHPIRQAVFHAVSALSGLREPDSFKLRQQGKKGFVQQIAGPRPSEGYFQEKIYGRPQDLSGRGTIAPDPNLKMNQIGLPEDTAWGIYKPFVVKRLVQMGLPALQAADHAEKKTEMARKALEVEVGERPLVFNRAPSLWRYSVLAAYPKIIPGKTIRISPFVEAPLGADYDGDCIQLHVPVSPQSINDAKKMTLDHMLFSDKKRHDLIPKPEMEAVIGLYEATRLGSTGAKKKYKNKEEAMQAYYRGDLKANDNVEIGK